MNRSPELPGEPGGEDADLLVLLAPADTRAGPAPRLSEGTFADLYLSAVDEVLADHAAPPSPTAPVVARLDEARTARSTASRTSASRPRPAPRWRRALAVAAGVLLALSVGAGASAVALRAFDVRLGSAELAPTAPVERPRTRPGPIAPAPPPPAPPADPVEIEVPRSAVEPPPARRPRPKRTHDVALAHPAPPPATVVPEDRPPDDLLSLANDRRHRRDWRAADLFYAAVETRFPGTDAAAVAAIASAALHLRHLEDAPGARAAYRRALAWRPSGPLAEDARWGLAEASRALGDPRGEADALREFLDRHPRSPLAAEARLRLATLSP